MPFKDGDFLLIEYVVKTVEDGEEKVIDTNIEEVAKKAKIYDPRRIYKPYPIILGRSGLFEDVEKALREMELGEEREVEIPPERGYGERREDLVKRFSIKYFQRQGRVPSVGEEIELAVEEGVVRGRVVKVTQRFVYVDFNHPLAGKKLKFKIKPVKKVEDDAEKAKILVARLMGLDIDQVKVTKEGDAFKISLPAKVLGINDLEAVLSRALQDLDRYLSPKKVVFSIEVDMRGEGGGSAEERVSSKEEQEASR